MMRSTQTSYKRRIREQLKAALVENNRKGVIKYASKICASRSSLIISMAVEEIMKKQFREVNVYLEDLQDMFKHLETQKVYELNSRVMRIPGTKAVQARATFFNLPVVFISIV